MKDDDKEMQRKQNEMARKIAEAANQPDPMLEKFRESYEKRQYTPPAIAAGHKHAEAFCLMHYQCKDCGHLERIWNSRDGVTPFSMRCPSCGNKNEPMGNMFHVAFNRDEYVPDYKLNRFQKYWRNITADEAANAMRARFRQMDGTQYMLSYEEKEQRIDKMRKAFSKGRNDCHEYNYQTPTLDVYLGD